MTQATEPQTYFIAHNDPIIFRALDKSLTQAGMINSQDINTVSIIVHDIQSLEEKDLAHSALYLLLRPPQGAIPAWLSDNKILHYRIFDYPLRIGELIHAAVRYRPRTSRALSIGPYRFDPLHGVLERDKAPAIRLTEKEADLLAQLYDADHRTLSREELLTQIWGYGDNIETHTLETHIYRLRQKIESDPANPKLVLTRDAGYCLNI